MTTRKLIGAALLALPFVALAIYGSIESGHWWYGPAAVLAAFAIAAIVLAGIVLIAGGDDE